MFSSKSSKPSRDELLEKARLEREARQGEKKRNTSAIIIQVIGYKIAVADVSNLIG